MTSKTIKEGLHFKKKRENTAAKQLHSIKKGHSLI